MNLFRKVSNIQKDYKFISDDSSPEDITLSIMFKIQMFVCDITEYVINVN